MRGILTLLLLLAAPARAAGTFPNDVGIEKGKIQPAGGALSDEQRAVFGALRHGEDLEGLHFVGVRVLGWKKLGERYVSEVQLLELQVQPRMDVVEGDLVFLGNYPGGGAMWVQDLELTGAEEGSGWVHARRTKHRFLVDGLLPRQPRRFVALWLDFAAGRPARPVTLLRGPAPGLVHGVDPWVFLNGDEVADVFAFTSLGAMPVDTGIHATAWERARRRAARLADLPEDQRSRLAYAEQAAVRRRAGPLDRWFLEVARAMAAADGASDDAALGWLSWALQDWEAASGPLLRASAARPDDPVTAVQAGQALLQTGRLDEAWALLEPWMAARHAPALGLCRSLADDEPERVEDCAHWTGPREQRQAAPLDFAAWDELQRWPSPGRVTSFGEVRVYERGDPEADPAFRIEVDLGPTDAEQLLVHYNPPGASWLTAKATVHGAGTYAVNVTLQRYDTTYFWCELRRGNDRLDSYSSRSDALRIEGP
mgnify:CR=1 FL=1